MSLRVVSTDTTVAWDNSSISVPAGTILDVQPGSAMETAFGGAGNARVLSGQPLNNVLTGSNPAPAMSGRSSGSRSPGWPGPTPTWPGWPSSPGSPARC